MRSDFLNFDHFSLPIKKEEISISSNRSGEEIRGFGQNIHPCFLAMVKIFTFPFISGLLFPVYHGPIISHVGVYF